mmetsp:Transcript_26882/g.77855  ORF Transcript_26882/g.77855 Transcript_26882/m.77855 type:complete len:478 (+) Transcript_26882:25-1458(+)
MKLEARGHVGQSCAGAFAICGDNTPGGESIVTPCSASSWSSSSAQRRDSGGPERLTAFATGAEPAWATCCRRFASSHSMQRKRQPSSATRPAAMCRRMAVMVHSKPPIFAQFADRPTVSHKFRKAPMARSCRSAFRGYRRIAITVTEMPPALTPKVLCSLFVLVAFIKTPRARHCNSSTHGKSRMAWQTTPRAPLEAAFAAADSSAKWPVLKASKTLHPATCIRTCAGWTCMQAMVTSIRSRPRCLTPASCRSMPAARRIAESMVTWPPAAPAVSGCANVSRSFSTQKASPSSRSPRRRTSRAALKSSVAASPSESEALCKASSARQAASATASSSGHSARAERQSLTPPLSKIRRALVGYLEAMTRKAPQASRCTSRSCGWRRSAVVNASMPPRRSTRAWRHCCARRCPAQSSRMEPQPAACSSGLSTWSATALATNSKPPHSQIFGRCCGRSARVHSATAAFAATSSPSASSPTT